MNEEDVQTFCDVTLQDRRTAIFCLQRHNNNLNLAITYYLDNSYRIVIPPDFMNDAGSSLSNNGDNSHSDPPRPANENNHDSTNANNNANANRNSQIIRNTSQQGVNQPPPASPIGSPSARQIRNVNKYQKEKPSLFIPFGVPLAEKPVAFDDHLSKGRKDLPPDPKLLFPSLNCPRVKCEVWKDGITWDSKFYSKNDTKCKEAMKQIEKNLLPTALFPDLEVVDVDIVFHKSKYSSEK
ncbi:hypothetical protein TRFO_43147 [Tritrichomonas foetus]|uniref:UBA domain-containing protein n=1 Tax=Tritrichomonas foetus TaxID=1144522 RepID=A0A1J4KSB3_9EUKA|nr:hypothetical protein TRFO_43147 [Tritrichomonas foetus]|eukprot:OHT14185.1 hypothetical protein TRFO_43147 [Tritrichomonas foetus]